MLKLRNLRCSQLLQPLIPMLIGVWIDFCRDPLTGLTSFSSMNEIPESQEEHIPSEPVDEAAQLEARRKRREAIRAKYRGQATPMRLQALHIGSSRDSSTPSVDTAASTSAVSGKLALSA